MINFKSVCLIVYDPVGNFFTSLKSLSYKKLKIVLTFLLFVKLRILVL